ncbi:hypothetical protein ES703_19419 [subsurface metagenome]
MTDVLLAKIPITGNPVVTHQPPTGQPGCIEVHISGYPLGPLSGGSGFVTISGTDASGATIIPPLGETLTFTENGVETGEEEFQTITSVTTTNLLPPFQITTGDIEIRLVTPSGQPVLWEYTVFKEMKCWCDLHRGGVIVQIPGGVVTRVTKLFTKYNPLTPILENDIIEFRNRKYRVDFIEETFTRSKVSPHHLELILKEAKTT